jgi:hypothetical protein
VARVEVERKPISIKEKKGFASVLLQILGIERDMEMSDYSSETGS